MTSVVKIHTKGIEPYNERKLAHSIHAVCLSILTPPGEAELTATRICQHLHVWVETKEEITTRDIRAHAAHYLSIYNPDAAYLYKTYYT
jgi:hypothetical protein